MTRSCTTIDLDAFDATRRAVEADPSAGKGAFSTTTSWVDGARARTTARSFVIETDEPSPLGGTDQAVGQRRLRRRRRHPGGDPQGRRGGLPDGRQHRKPHPAHRNVPDLGSGVMPSKLDRAGVQRLVSEEAAQLVEVLPRGEYDEEHLDGAIHIPLKQLDTAATEVLDRSRAVIVYCWDGL